MTSKKFERPADWKFGCFKTQDGSDIRYGVVHPKSSPKGTVVITGGYGRHIEYYYEKINNWLDRGYSVYAMDWFGQGGSCRENPEFPHKPGTKDFGNHVEHFDEFIKKIVKPDPSKPAYLSSHSKGGNIMLRYLHEHEDDPDFPFTGAILGAPMIDINIKMLPRKAFAKTVSAMDKVGLQHTPILSIPKVIEDFMDAVIGRWKTKLDIEREHIHAEYKRDTEHLVLGFPTIGWLREAFNSCNMVPKRNSCKKYKHPS